MKYGFFAIIVLFVLRAIPASAFESKNAESKQRDLRIELEAVPSPVQENFDRYIEDLAAAAQWDERQEEQARKEQLAKARQLKVVNPIVLFRW